MAPPSRIGEREYNWTIEGEFPVIDPRNYLLDQPLANLPHEAIRGRVSELIGELRLASQLSQLTVIGEGGRPADDLDFLWRLASLEIDGAISKSIILEALAATKSKKPEKRVAYFRSAVLARCKPQGIEFHKLLEQVKVPEDFPSPSPSPFQKIPNRTETEPNPNSLMQHKRTQENSGDTSNSGHPGNSSHEGESKDSTNSVIARKATKRANYSGPYLKLNELSEPLKSDIESAIMATQPTGAGKRELLLFELARRFKAIPQIAKLEIWAFEIIIREWHQRALTKIGTKPFSETWSDFIRGWSRVHTPYGDALRSALKEAKETPIPECVAHHDSPCLLDFARLCKVLQARTKGEPIFLACGALGDLFRVDRTTAWRWIDTGRVEGWLEEVSKGSMKSKKASEYFCVCD